MRVMPLSMRPSSSMKASARRSSSSAFMKICAFTSSTYCSTVCSPMIKQHHLRVISAMLCASAVDWLHRINHRRDAENRREGLQSGTAALSEQVLQLRPNSAPARKPLKKHCQATNDLFLSYLSRQRRCSLHPRYVLPEEFDRPVFLVGNFNPLHHCWCRLIRDRHYRINHGQQSNFGSYGPFAIKHCIDGRSRIRRIVYSDQNANGLVTGAVRTTRDTDRAARFVQHSLRDAAQYQTASKNGVATRSHDDEVRFPLIRLSDDGPRWRVSFSLVADLPARKL